MDMNEPQRHYLQITNGVYVARVSANTVSLPYKIVISLGSAFGYNALVAMIKYEGSNAESAEPYLKQKNTFYKTLILCLETNMNSSSELSYPSDRMSVHTLFSATI
jgi:hypothetical protein